MKKKIVWITADYFIDVDLPVLPYLSSTFDIDWFIVISKSNKINYLESIQDKIYQTKINFQVVQIKSRIRNPRAIYEYYNIVMKMNRLNADAVYIDLPGMPFFLPLVRLFLDINKVVVATHNVTTPKGAVNERLADLYMRFTLNSFKNFHVFSRSQRDILCSRFPNKSVLFAPLALKDYGISKEIPGNLITFINFGIIRDYKRVDVLIQAANRAYEETGMLFKVKIAGACQNWDKYQKLIKYPFLFDLCIGFISNNEVADLISSSHYFVLPYQDIAQSGAITVAFNYNVPVIASNLPAFSEYILHKKTGYLFEPASVNELSDIMIYILKQNNKNYFELKLAQRQFVEYNLSIKTITQMYLQYFQNLCK